MTLYRTFIVSVVGIGGMYALSFGVERLTEYLESTVLYGVVGLSWGVAYCHFHNGVTKEKSCSRQIETFGGTFSALGVAVYYLPLEIDPIVFLWFMFVSLFVACGCTIYGTLWRSKNG